MRGGIGAIHCKSQIVHFCKNLASARFTNIGIFYKVLIIIIFDTQRRFLKHRNIDRITIIAEN